MKYQVYNQIAEPVSEITLADSVFNVVVKPELVQQAAITQMANARQVLAHTKDRSEVAGSGKKPWKQKGTGRARVGSVRSPIWRSGGVTFGPTKDRNFTKELNKKMRQKAMLMVLSDKVANQNLVIVDKLSMADYSTKTFKQIITALTDKVWPENKAKRSLLIVDDSQDVKLQLSSRNLTGVTVINLENINIVDLLNNRNLLLTKNVIKILEKRYKHDKK
ncbi:MAG: 50S ribosomal protein L4 [bacterium]